METSVTPCSHEEFARYMAGAEVVGVRLIRANVECFNPAPLPPEVHIEAPLESRWNQSDGMFDVHAHYRVTIRPTSAADAAPLATFEVYWGVLFRCAEPMRLDIFQYLVNSTLWMLLAPFMRQFVHDMTARMGWGPITLPLVKVGLPPPPAGPPERAVRPRKRRTKPQP